MHLVIDFPIGGPWNVRVLQGKGQHLLCGLNTKIPSVGIIKEFSLEFSECDFTNFQPDHLRGTTALHLIYCKLTNTDSGFLKVLHQLSGDNSNVTSLTFVMHMVKSTWLIPMTTSQPSSV